MNSIFIALNGVHPNIEDQEENFVFLHYLPPFLSHFSFIQDIRFSPEPLVQVGAAVEDDGISKIHRLYCGHFELR